MGKIENGTYYNSNGEAYHRGTVEIDGKIYYAGKGGVIVKNRRKTIHHGMANGLLHHGSYYFDKDGVCDLNSFKEAKHKQQNKTEKVKKFDKMKDILLAILLFIILVFIAFVVITDFATANSSIEKATEETEAVTEQESQIEISLPTFDDEVYLCTDAIKAYYNGEYTLQEIVEAGAKAYKALAFEYKIQNAESATLLISEKDDYSESLKFDLDVSDNSVSIDNLKTDTTYYYLITAKATDGAEQSESGTFNTAETNRFISFDGVYNTRDIGGYDTIYGKKVKQGVLIRGTELDGLVVSSYYLKDVAAIENFGFVCDFDLRSSSIFNTKYVSRLGTDITHKFYDSPMYGGIFSVGTETLLKEIFTDLADKNNYPMYLHCTYGADRTGTVVYLLQGLLGVSEEDMKTEYELTGFFSKDYVYGDGINSVYSGVQGCNGDTLNEKIENYMLDTVGLTKEQIQSIRDIFLG